MVQIWQDCIWTLPYIGCAVYLSFYLQEEVDRILDKINDYGFENLTQEEQGQLYKGSRSLYQSKKKD